MKIKKLLTELNLITETSHDDYVVFDIQNDKLYDEIPEHIKNEIDFDRDSDYENLLLPRKEYEKFCNWALSSGYNEGEDWAEINK